MKTIMVNIVGLFKFTCLLFLVSIPFKVKRRTEPRDEKYKSILREQTAPLVVSTEVKFCPICHAQVAMLRHTEKGTQVIKDGKVQLTVGNITFSKGNKMVKGLPIKCPNGHTVRIE